MYLKSFLFFPLANLVNAKVESTQNGNMMDPEVVGYYHTDAFEKLADLYSVKKPRSKIDIMMDLSNIVASYCDEGDSECLSNVYKSIIHEFHISQNGVRSVQYPEDYDMKLMSYIIEIDSTLNLLDTDGLDKVINKLTSIQSDIKNVTDSNLGYQTAALCGASVAIESAKLWHKTYNDVEHPLYGLHDISYFSGAKDEQEGNKRRRKLQNLNPSNIVRSDVNGAIGSVIASISESPFDILNPFGLVLSAIAASIPASAASLIGSEEDEYDYYEKEEEEDDEKEYGYYKKEENYYA